MKNYLLISILFVLTLSSCEEEISLNSNFTKHFTIYSTEKGRTYPIWVQLPEDYNQNTELYSTIYVLDADDNQEYVAKCAKDASTRLKTKNVIVVGIGYGDDRTVDYTPTHTNMGGGESPIFLDFINNELIPKIQTDFRADTSRNSRVILGHSFGGLCGAYAFTKRNEIFGNYLMLSASLFYDNDLMIQYEQESRPQIHNEQQLVYIGAGGTEGPLLVDNDLLHLRLKSYFYTQTKTTFQIIEGKGHNASKNPNIKKAINFYFQNR
ncbi:MAG: alpha/beta hydrolase-fold protein [Flavobacterium sp.]|uniref:alpha/beta hydrolase n=1 Tax=Flavobacterium sp. TaxID=239 RepID=UPI003267F94C